MDQLLRNNLLALLEVYLATAGGKESTIAQRAAGDWRFYKRLADPTVTFTVRKYEETLAWFDYNWPEGAIWPDVVPRPGDVPVLVGRAGSAISAEARP